MFSLGNSLSLPLFADLMPDGAGGIAAAANGAVEVGAGSVASVVPGALSTASCSGLPVPRGPAILSRMGTKSRETIYGASIRAAAERATEARKEADRLAVAAWNKRMLGFQGPAQPSPALGDALNAGYRYLEVKCLGCNTHGHRAATEDNAGP